MRTLALTCSSYITMQLPSNLILTRMRPSIYLPLFVCIWSAVSASTAAANNYKHLLAIRFILGISEAPFFPGVFYLLSCWYTRRELALRTAILYSGVILATAFSGLIAAGVFAQLGGAQGIASWRWLFIIEGALSFAFGLLALVVLPDFPGKRTGSARWLFNEEEHRVAGLRIERDRTAVEEGSKSVWYGLQLAVKDCRTWVFVSSTTGGKDSPMLMMPAGFDAHLKPHCLWIQLLLPDHRQGLQPRIRNNHPGVHCTALSLRHLHRHGNCVFQRPPWRARIPHCWTNARRRRRLHHYSCHFQCSGPILCFFPLHLWMLLGKRRRLQLGIWIFGTDSGEEGCCGRAGQSSLAAGQHLESLLLRSERLTKVHSGDDFDDGFCFAECCLLCGHEVVAQAGEQEDLG